MLSVSTTVHRYGWGRWWASRKLEAQLELVFVG